MKTTIVVILIVFILLSAAIYGCVIIASEADDEAERMFIEFLKEKEELLNINEQEKVIKKGSK